jgi:hypothetical protein
MNTRIPMGTTVTTLAEDAAEPHGGAAAGGPLGGLLAAAP